MVQYTNPNYMDYRERRSIIFIILVPIPLT